jgi:hypothetical protein
MPFVIDELGTKSGPAFTLKRASIKRQGERMRTALQKIRANIANTASYDVLLNTSRQAIEKKLSEATNPFVLPLIMAGEAGPERLVASPLSFGHPGTTTTASTTAGFR